MASIDLQTLNKHLESIKKKHAFLRLDAPDPADVRREYLSAMIHLRFVCELYNMQMQQGRYFVHEHPHAATSWREECIQSLLAKDGVDITVVD